MAMSRSAVYAVLLQAAVVITTGAAVGVGQLSATDNSFTWHGADGSYRFGLKGEDQWRVETRDRYGSVLGQYRYRTPDGGMVKMKFSAGPNNQHLATAQRDLLALKDRVGGGGELLLDTDRVRPGISGLPSYSSQPSSQSHFQEQTFDTRGNSEPTVLVNDGQTKQRAKVAIAALRQKEQVMPYGALLMVIAGDPLPLLPGTEHTHLKAIVTDVEPIP